jgi:hypothetical protein
LGAPATDRTTRIATVLALIPLLLGSCTSPAPPEAITTAAWPGPGIPIEPATRADFLAALLPREEQRALAGFEYSDSASILRFAPGTIPGETLPFLGFRVRADQPLVNKGERTEVTLNYPFTAGSTVTYHWEFRVPSTFKNDYPKNRHNQIAQWHDQPDTTKGESWATFPANSPPVSLDLTSRDGTTLQLSLNIWNVHPRTSAVFELATIPFDRWIPISVEITWSQDALHGAVAVFLNRETTPTHTFRGITMHNGVTHYLKLGLYRHHDIDVENWIYLRQVWCEPLSR